MEKLPPEYARPAYRAPWYETPMVVFLGLGVGTVLAWVSVTAVCALIDWALS